jgi:hypothetical protein
MKNVQAAEEASALQRIHSEKKFFAIYFLWVIFPAWIRIQPTKIDANTCRSGSTVLAFFHHRSTVQHETIDFDMEGIFFFRLMTFLNKDCHSVVGMCEPAYEDESAMDTSRHYSGQTIGERIHSIQPVWQPGKNSALTAA